MDEAVVRIHKSDVASVSKGINTVIIIDLYPYVIVTNKDTLKDGDVYCPKVIDCTGQTESYVHGRWCETIVDAVNADVDSELYDTSNPGKQSVYMSFHEIEQDIRHAARKAIQIFKDDTYR